jgi:hypothetical protein
MAVHKHALRFNLQEALILKIHISMLILSLTIYLFKTNHNVILPSLPRCSGRCFFLLYQNYTHIVPLVSLVLDTCPAILTIPRVLYEQPSSSFFNVFKFLRFFVFILPTYVLEHQAYTVQTFYNRIDSNNLTSVN